MKINLHDTLNYGIIGNCRTAALISDTAEIIWACIPDFNSYSVFAKLLDNEKGGSFGLVPIGEYTIRQCYVKNTNIIVTSFSNEQAQFEIYDFMPRYKNELNKYHCPPEIIRYIKHIHGTPEIKVIYNPQLCYASCATVSFINDHYIKSYSENGPYESIYLYSDIAFETIVSSTPFTVTHDCFFWLSYNQKIRRPNLENAYLDYEKTKVYWLDWTSRTTQFPPYENEVNRSALVLKLLSYQKSGAILAAPTTSLPETIGEVRNWDYRFCWIRDGSMILDTLTRLGHYNVAKRYISFILDVIPYKNEKIQIMYGINGEKNLTEKVLSHLKGYAHSLPVRIGNAAFKQKQNDVYGILVDIIYKSILIFKEDIGIIEDLWTVVRSLLKTVSHVWHKPDNGIWEFRGDRKHFVFSKVLCWAAADRGVKIAELFGMKEYVSQWCALRDTIREDIINNGWNEQKQAFTQYYGSSDCDASNVLMEFYGFCTADDVRYKRTVQRTYEELCVGGLMYRYRNSDDFGVPTSSFTVCTFWMIESLYKIGMRSEAEELFRKLLSHGNHLGLFSEDIDFESRRLLGNFPQGYSHLALINTAITLSSHNGAQKRIVW